MAENEIIYEEKTENLEVMGVENPAIVVSEADGIFADTNDMTIHNNLHDRDALEAHPISAIKNLREELDALNTAETPQVLYSNEFGAADYYEWADGHKYNDYGYFVTVKPGTTQIKICEGADIFGVTVNQAAFVGGYQKDGYGNTHALVATSGLVDVRCASEVNTGDYVISNQSGVAIKSDVDAGYKVVAVEQNVNTGDKYATIVLDISADQFDATNVHLQNALDRLEAAEQNITAAMTTAQKAYNQSLESTSSNKELNDKVDGALDYIEDKTDEIDKNINYITGVAKDAMDTAQSMKDTAVQTANDAWDEATKATEGVKELETLSETLLSRTNQNADEIYSLLTSIDKYCVGEYSQSNGLTIAQARNILQEGMIYIPTPHGNDETHYERYTYVDSDGNSHIVVQPFSAGSFYVWADFEYTLTSEDGNEVDMTGLWWKQFLDQVWTSTYDIPAGDSHTYWYLDGQVSEALKAQGFESNALYKRVAILNEDGETVKEFKWEKVNTLAGNVNSRMTSMIKQQADQVEIALTNTMGSVVEIQGVIDDTEARLTEVVGWKDGVDESMATIERKADAAGASISQVVSQICSEYITIEDEWDEENKDFDKVYHTTIDGKYWYFDEEDEMWHSTDYPTEAGLVVSGASIVTAINNDGSATKIKADHIEIDGAHINLTAEQITAVADQVTLEGKVSVNGTFTIDEEGYMRTTGGTIGGWNISENGIIATNNKAGMLSSGSSARFFAGTMLPLQETLTTIETVNIMSLMTHYDALSGMWIFDYTPKFISGGVSGTDYQIIEIQQIGDGIRCNIANISIIPGGQRISIAMSKEPLTEASVQVQFTYSQEVTSCEFTVKEDGTLYASKAHITGEITATTGEIGGWNVGTIPNGAGNNVWGNENYTNSLYSISQVSDDSNEYLAFLRVPETSNGHVFSVRMKDTGGNVTTPFSVAKNGHLIAESAEIKGDINATSGEIGSLHIGDGLVGYDAVNEVETFSLTGEGLSIIDSTASVRVGNLSIATNDKGTATTLQAEGPLFIRGIAMKDGEAWVASSIELMDDDGMDRAEADITLEVYQTDNKKVTGRLKTSKPLYYPVSYKIYSRVEQDYLFNDDNIHSWNVTIAAGQTYSKLLGFGAATTSIFGGDVYYQIALSRQDLKDAPKNKVSTLSTSWQHFLDVDHVIQRQPSNNIRIGGHLIPKAVTYNLGATNSRWQQGWFSEVYNSSGEIKTSDLHKKNSISQLPNDYNIIFDSLKPVIFKYNDGRSDRFHSGFIAQDVKEAILKAGLTTKDFAAYCEWVDSDGNESCGLRYSELIALCVDEIQKLKKRVAELEEQHCKNNEE